MLSGPPALAKPAGQRPQRRAHPDATEVEQSITLTQLPRTHIGPRKHRPLYWRFLCTLHSQQNDQQPNGGYSACRGTTPTRLDTTVATNASLSACSHERPFDLDSYDACITGYDARNTQPGSCCKLNLANRHDVVESRAPLRSRCDPSSCRDAPRRQTSPVSIKESL